ncbi:hypothetical protein FCULG_00007072 [Fusarium culmorum]|uniref:Uncharacterized protein n=1 Tax=Fusarium culmorum TaxID=5516 RepID=A0A2T4GV91_FUSCU|nr:hypothetical protein FCULG_00007072 [Fusarium culmorum]
MASLSCLLQYYLLWVRRRSGLLSSTIPILRSGPASLSGYIIFIAEMPVHDPKGTKGLRTQDTISQPLQQPSPRPTTTITDNDERNIV